jgi:hypothetical protein
MQQTFIALFRLSSVPGISTPEALISSLLEALLSGSFVVAPVVVDSRSVPADVLGKSPLKRPELGNLTTTTGAFDFSAIQE